MDTIIDDPDVRRLNDRSPMVRWEARHAVADKIERGEIVLNQETRETNNHIHTKFSFSPYYPMIAAFLAKYHGLQTVGSTDHDSFSAALEMKRAGRFFNIGATVGFEVRVNMEEFGYKGVTINNPDSKGIAYVVAHGVPIIFADIVNEWLMPINHARNIRNETMVGELNGLLSDLGIEGIDFKTEVYDASEAHVGGSITERHILDALSGKILAQTTPENIVSFLEGSLKVKKMDEVLQERLKNEKNPHRQYDLLGVLKSSFLPQFYMQPNSKECPPGSEFIELCNRVQAISTMAYLGDVKASPTGDKKPQAFEDGYLDEHVPKLVEIGFFATAYMFSRNDNAQRMRIRRLCKEYRRMQINGEDINSSRQIYNCPILNQVRFTNLQRSAWALVGHEYEVNNGREGLSAIDPKKSMSTLDRRIKHFAEIGRRSTREQAYNLF